MRLQWLLAYLRMCNYSCDIVAVNADTGEVIRSAPIDLFGLKATGLIVKSFNYDGKYLVAYLN